MCTLAADALSFYQELRNPCKDYKFYYFVVLVAHQFIFALTRYENRIIISKKVYRSNTSKSKATERQDVEIEFCLLGNRAFFEKNHIRSKYEIC